MQDVSTIPVKAVGKIIDAAAEAGVKPEHLYQAVNLDPALLADPDNRIPFAQLVTLYEQAARLTGDDAFGLHVGERATPKMFDVLGYVVMNSPNFGEAIQRLIRYYRIWCDGAEYRLKIDGAMAQIEYKYQMSECSVEERRQDCECTFSIFVNSGCFATGVAWTPREVSFQHAQPQNTAEHQRIFRAPVSFDMPVNELVFDRSILDLPLMKADPDLCAVLDRHAEELLARFPRRGGLTDRVRELLSELLQGGDPELETIARQLGMSARSLQRRLKDEGASHTGLLDEMRRDLSKQYLQEPQIAICEVAYLLGFSEPSAFNRAFRRWTGISPKEYRRALAK